jgi:HSP20 family protein
MSDNTQITQRDPNAMTGAESDEVRRRVTLTPAVDIVEDAHSVTVWVDLPGVQKDKLDIRVHDGSLTIDAESVVPVTPNLRLSHAEIRAPYFHDGSRSAKTSTPPASRPP